MKKTKTKTTNRETLVLDVVTTSFLPDNDKMHVYKNKTGQKIICLTDSKGHPNPNNANPKKIVIDATAGFIPLWAKGVTLKWRFNKSFGRYFNNAEAAKEECRNLLSESILKWKDACPVKFKEDDDVWDFEVRMAKDDCDASGCVLASAFFPQQGQDYLILYPKLFKQTRQEQIETLIHELGHVFGLRHFFAQVTEKTWRSEIFGDHNPFSIMNYGEQSILTNTDIEDLKKLYELVWSGKLTEVNGTPIVLFRPYHMSKLLSTLNKHQQNIPI